MRDVCNCFVGVCVAVSRAVKSSTSRSAPCPAPADRLPELVRDAAALLARADESGLCAHLEAGWTAADLAEALDQALARQAGVDTLKIATICLGLVGTMAETPVVARALHHDDYFVTSIAERSLWNIWFRASSPQCCNLLQDAIREIHAERYHDAERTLDRILLLDPDFAEACNQRAILHYLTARFSSSLMACRRTLALNPYHFGAAAGLGHNHLLLGQPQDAIRAYRRALRIHPRMEGVRQQLRRAREAEAAPVAGLVGRRPN